MAVPEIDLARIRRWADGRVPEHARDQVWIELADSTAVSLTRNPAGLRSALEKLLADTAVVRKTARATAHLWIESPLDREHSGSWLDTMFDTHPLLTQRIERLRAMESGRY